MQPGQPKNLLPEIVALARRAGDAILEVYAQTVRGHDERRSVAADAR